MACRLRTLYFVGKTYFPVLSLLLSFTSYFTILSPSSDPLPDRLFIRVPLLASFTPTLHDYSRTPNRLLLLLPWTTRTTRLDALRPPVRLLWPGGHVVKGDFDPWPTCSDDGILVSTNFLSRVGPGLSSSSLWILLLVGCRGFPPRTSDFLFATVCHGPYLANYEIWTRFDWLIALWFDH